MSAIKSPPRGHLITGMVQPLASGGLELQGYATLNQLEAMGFLRPSELQHATMNEYRGDPVARDNKRLRDSIQRPFDKVRMNNATTFRDYIIRTEVNKERGNCPAITLYTPKATEHEDGLVIPFGAPMIAPDGETQSDARFMVRNLYPETGDRLFKVTVMANEPEIYAQIILVDYNSHGTKVKNKIVRTCDPRGHINSALIEACLHARLDADRHINRFGYAKRHEVAGSEQLRAAFVGTAIGIKEPWNRPHDRLNEEGFDQRDQAILIVGELLELIAAGSLVELRKADPLWWQAVAHLINQGRDAKTLKFAAALSAVSNAKTDRQRLSATERLSILSQAL